MSKPPNISLQKPFGIDPVLHDFCAVTRNKESRDGMSALVKQVMLTGTVRPDDLHRISDLGGSAILDELAGMMTNGNRDDLLTIAADGSVKFGHLIDAMTLLSAPGGKYHRTHKKAKAEEWGVAGTIAGIIGGIIGVIIGAVILVPVIAVMWLIFDIFG